MNQLAKFARNSAYRLQRRYKGLIGSLTLGCRALVVRDDKVLLVRHSYQEGWYLPGGAVERGESLHEAVTRELLEECSLRARSAKLVAMFFSEMEGRSDHVALFAVKDFEEVPGLKRDPEIAELGFFPLAKLPEGTSPATRRRLAEFLGGAEPPARW